MNIVLGLKLLNNYLVIIWGGLEPPTYTLSTYHSTDWVTRLVKPSRPWWPVLEDSILGAASAWALGSGTSPAPGSSFQVLIIEWTQKAQDTFFCNRFLFIISITYILGVSQGIISLGQISDCIKNFVLFCNETGEVGFEPTTRILEIPILPIKLHSYKKKDF